ncbi:hypothetical protein TrCOL_g4838 [Triparma columacea]|uniref:Uncharacterized protein n=1 Tax=Triparma columacea TaxID=722753 RepID=A0A9W7LD42_9STRA|nr:hypothetical protein TrCOL_g4838 [Triparma columacea]
MEKVIKKLKEELEEIKGREVIWKEVFMEGGIGEARKVRGYGGGGGNESLDKVEDGKTDETRSKILESEDKSGQNNVEPTDESSSSPSETTDESSLAQLVSLQGCVIASLKSQITSLSKLSSQISDLEGQVLLKDKAFRRLSDRSSMQGRSILEWEKRSTAWGMRESALVDKVEKAVKERDEGYRINKELGVKVEEIRTLKNRGEERLERERRRMEEWVGEEEERIKNWAKGREDKARIWIENQVKEERERVERIRDEGISGEVVEIARRMAKVRKENGKLKKENEHLKRELRRAAERIVNMVREREEGVKDLGFVPK